MHPNAVLVSISHHPNLALPHEVEPEKPHENTRATQHRTKKTYIASSCETTPITNGTHAASKKREAAPKYPHYIMQKLGP